MSSKIISPNVTRKTRRPMVRIDYSPLVRYSQIHIELFRFHVEPEEPSQKKKWIEEHKQDAMLSFN